MNVLTKIINVVLFIMLLGACTHFVQTGDMWTIWMMLALTLFVNFDRWWENRL